ncbi:MAG: long-chain-fatty-acid--CoA ligase, partial [Burkholderiales bacterium]|nr:long-chain-fatty-acid--CoA ligase [Burkholderiales bacterium]
KNSPNKTAIIDNNTKISNAEFKKLIDVVAEYLYICKIKPSDKVALIMNNSWQFVVCFFAISKLGAICVPVNNFLKEEELAYILNDAQVNLFFSSFKFAKETLNLINKTQATQIVWVDGVPLENDQNVSFAKIIAKEYSNLHSTYPTTLDNTAVIVYTSGTTGKPKGAKLAFRNIISNCSAIAAEVSKKPGDMPMIAYLPMFHAFSLTVTILVPIFTSSKITIIRSISGIKDFKQVLKHILFSRCRYFAGIPDIYKVMAKAKLPWYFHFFHNVTGFISGAAPLAETVYINFNRSFKRGELLEGYGITECSPVVSCNLPGSNRPSSVGQPLADYKVKIMNEQMQELPIGEAGEIWVSGDCVMQGYHNKPIETNEAIIDGWFRTGDMGKVDHDGYIYIVDRIKDIIINKGMNIYPREIEELLYTYDKVGECSVIGEYDENENELPIAYIVLKENCDANEAEIKEFLRPQIAAFKMIKKVVFAKELPKNSTGKILKRKLRELHNSTLKKN